MTDRILDASDGVTVQVHDTPREAATDLRARLRALPVFDVALPEFDPETAPERPEALFAQWLLTAIEAGVRGPHALVLSTVDADDRPSARVLILKGLDDGGWEFATSRSSRKGQELETSPWAAMTFHWREQGRQIRLRGRVVDGGPAASKRDYDARSAAARAEVAEDDWVLYRLIPDEVEFWQADTGRRHVRLRYRLRDGAWRRERLPA